MTLECDLQVENVVDHVLDDFQFRHFSILRNAWHQLFEFRQQGLHLLTVQLTLPCFRGGQRLAGLGYARISASGRHDSRVDSISIGQWFGCRDFGHLCAQSLSNTC